MKTKLLLIFTLIFASIVVTFTSCKKDKYVDTQTAEDVAKSSYIASDIYLIAFDALKNKGSKSFEECFVVDSYEGGVLLTYNNCTDGGITRNGVIKIEGKLSDFTISFENYSTNGNIISGSIESKFSLLEKYTIKNNLTFTNSENVKISWRSEKQYELEGLKLIYNGSSTGINRLGESYSAISESITFDNCPWPVSGTIKIKKDDEEQIIVDFDEDGTADCDLSVKVKQNGNSKIIDLNID